MLRLLIKLNLYLSAVGVAIMATLIAWIVFMRFFAGVTPHWAEELPQFLLIWVAMTGAVWCSKNNSHLSAGILALWLKNQQITRLLHRLVDVLIIVAMIVLTKSGWDLTLLTINQHTPAMQWPVGLLYLSVPVSCTFIGLVHIATLYASWRPSHE
ncbi:TRAP transporter small permease [Marinomonas arenicola]|uniref:TRAP transporter small permease n=1 Tax=Marinomonas arenicola TaxID=569601 RepID=UPI00311F38F2